MYDFLIVLAGYIVGSIPFSLLIARMFGVPDLRKVGSGNTGATNVMRTAGKIPALIAAIFDIGKGAAAVLVAAKFGGSYFGDLEYLKLLAGIAAIVGHIFPVFLRFKGGKGVNTALGVFMTLLTVPTLIAFGIFIITVSVSRYVSLGSILAAVSLPVILILCDIFDIGTFHKIYLLVTVLLALMILITHRSNIRRLLSSSENKFSFQKKSTAEVK